MNSNVLAQDLVRKAVIEVAQLEERELLIVIEMMDTLKKQRSRPNKELAAEVLAKAKALCPGLGFGVLIGLRVSFVMFPCGSVWCRASATRARVGFFRDGSTDIARAVRIDHGCGDRDAGRRRIGRADAGACRAAFHGPSRNSRTTARCSGCTSMGAWPIPANSRSRARGPRCVMANAVSCDNRSESAPRSSSVGQATRS